MTIDTQKFQALLLATEVASPNRDDGAHMRKHYDECRAALVDHLNIVVTAARAAIPDGWTVRSWYSPAEGAYYISGRTVPAKFKASAVPLYAPPQFAALAGATPQIQRYAPCLFKHKDEVLPDMREADDGEFVAYADHMVAPRYAHGSVAQLSQEEIGEIAEEAAHLTCRYSDASINFYTLKEQIEKQIKAVLSKRAARPTPSEAPPMLVDHNAHEEGRHTIVGTLPRQHTIVGPLGTDTSQPAPSAGPAQPADGFVVVPRKLTPKMADVLQFGKTQPVHNTWLNLIAVGAAPAQQAPDNPALLEMYERHKGWAVRSGYTPMPWEEFKASSIPHPR